MTTNVDFMVVLLCLGVASFVCRAGGFFLMRYVRATPRIQAALSAIPVAAMIGIVTPALVAGRPADLAGLAAVLAIKQFTRHDIIAMLGGVAVVAAARALGL